MKKIYLLLTVAAGILFSSCNMDLAPIGSLDDENAIESTSDLKKARNGIYEGLRRAVTGEFIYYTDIQMDQFMGLTINGNQVGSFAHGSIYSNDRDILSVWASMYSYIADCNYLLGAAEKLLENPDLTAEDLLDINRYIGETKFARAYYYYYMFDHWCDTYKASTANDPAKGVPVVTVFNPTGDISAYPGRSTVAETLALINQDLEDAYIALKDFEETGYTVVPMDFYVNSYVVLALQARMAFLCSDWNTTVEKCNEIIDSGIYTLATTSNYAQMWTDDNSNEIIFRPYSSNTELGIGSTGEPYISASQQSAWYIPTAEFLGLYDQTNDVRFAAFFTDYYLVANGTTYQAYVFNKYPGNQALYQGTTNNIRNMGKPFRLSETYLMLAEASYELNDATTANDALTTLRKARIKRMLGSTSYAGVELRDQIRLERTKELIGEGFRMSDLRRWGEGFTRDSSYPENPAVEEIFVTVDTQVEYKAGDYRYVWPIPSGEMQNNPQIRGQQNPGY